MHPFISLPFGKIGSFPLCIGAGLMILVLLFLYRARRMGLPVATVNDRLLPALPLCLLFGVVSGAVTDVLFHDGVRQVFAHPFGRGLNYFGWLLGCMLFWIAFGRMAGIPVLLLLELFVPGCLPAQAVGRLGCFLGGCCYGIPVRAPWGVVYPAGSPPCVAYGSVPLCPVQLYEAGWLLVAFTLAMTAVKAGYRAGFSLVACGAGRIALELLRGDSRGTILEGVPVSPGQFLGGVFVLVGGMMMIGRRMQDRGNRTCKTTIHS